MFKKPEKFYKNLEHTRQECCFYDSKKIKDTTFWPCLECERGGCGWIYDPNDAPDTVEGYKMVNRIKCPKCNGTGIGSRKEIITEYHRINNKWKADYKKYREAVKKMNQLKKKLSKDDMELIVRYMSHYKYDY